MTRTAALPSEPHGLRVWRQAANDNPASQTCAERRRSIATRGLSNDAYAFTALTPGSKAYAVNGLNQYTHVGGGVHDYDANGNLSWDRVTNYAYDPENRLVGSDAGGQNVALRYDPLGRLYEVTGSQTGTRRFLYDGDELVAEYDSAGSMVKRYVHGAGIDDPMVEYTGPTLGSRVFLHADHQGSVIAVSDVPGNASAINSYDEYGIPAAGNASVSAGGRFGYTGQIWIPELGLWYYKARFYSPTLGRFLQVDPIGYDDQINLYAYVGNDPTNKIDPEGTQWIGPSNFIAQTIEDDPGILLDIGFIAFDFANFPSGESLGMIAARRSAAAAAWSAKFTSKKIADIGAKRAILNRQHYRAAIGEAKGTFSKYNPRTGKPFDHIKEIKDAVGGLKRDLSSAQAKINEGRLSPADSAQLQESVAKGQKLLNEAESVLRDVAKCATGSRICP